MFSFTYEVQKYKITYKQFSFVKKTIKSHLSQHIWSTRLDGATKKIDDIELRVLVKIIELTVTMMHKLN